MTWQFVNLWLQPVWVRLWVFGDSSPHAESPVQSPCAWYWRSLVTATTCGQSLKVENIQCNHWAANDLLPSNFFGLICSFGTHQPVIQVTNTQSRVLSLWMNPPWIHQSEDVLGYTGHRRAIVWLEKMKMVYINKPDEWLSVSSFLLLYYCCSNSHQATACPLFYVPPALWSVTWFEPAAISEPR